MSAVDVVNVAGDKIMKLEEQTIPAENSDGDKIEGSVDLEWPATLPLSPRYLIF